MKQRVPFCEHIKVRNFNNIDFNNINLSGNGDYQKKVIEEMKKNYGDSQIFLLPSGTAALEMGCLLLDVTKGDEVIIPSFTFTSTANAILLRGGTPVFVDIKPGSLDMDENLLRKAITSRTKIIMPVFYGGASSNIDELTIIAKENNVFLFPDAAQAIGSYYDNMPLEKFGNLSALSFHQTKNIGCGEGGALIINDKSFVKRAEIIQEKGTNRSEFFKGEVDKYTWKDVGSSYLMSELCSAFLCESIYKIDEITKRRREKWQYYYDNLSELSHKISLPNYSSKCTHNGHIFFIEFKDSKLTEYIKVNLNKIGVNVVSHYYPLHLTKIGKDKCKLGSKMTVTENIYDKILRLPLFDHITKEQQDYTIDSLKNLL